MLQRAKAAAPVADAQKPGRSVAGPNNAQLQALAATLNGATAEPPAEGQPSTSPVQRMLGRGRPVPWRPFRLPL